MGQDKGIWLGAGLVAGSAIIWSFGGAIAREISTGDQWTVVFWRSVWAAIFLILFMLLRDGPRGTLALFRAMGWPGVAVACFFSTASTTFIIALQHTTVANILLIQSSVPLIAALMSWLIFRQTVSAPTWAAIAAVIFGVGVMVSESLGGTVSPLGSALSLLIALAFASATIITQRFSHVRMMPACFLGTMISMTVSASMAQGLAVTLTDMGLLLTFGAFNLGLGLAFFVTGVRRVPATLAALVGTLETVLGPLWVWLTHDEVPSFRTLLGGSIVLAALVAHLLSQLIWGERGEKAKAAVPNMQ
jgi:drug/metabolite transporter (DMT)-like permease